jgi:hypothetical protein
MTTPNHLAVSEELASTIGEMYDSYFTDAEETSEPTVEGETEEVVATDEATDSHPEEGADESAEEVEESEADAEPSTETTEDVPADGEGETDEEVQRFTVKVNGEEHQVEMDELVRGYQTMRAANEKFEAAATREKELDEYVEFAKGFTEAIQSDPAGLFAEYVDLVQDPNTVIVKMIERAAAVGKLHPELAEALGISEQDTLTARAEYERGRREKLEQQINQKSVEQPDQFGYTTADYNRIADELVGAAGLVDADIDVQRKFVADLAEFRANRNIANPYLAFAEMQKSRVTEVAAAQAAATATAVKQAVKPKRIPGSSASGGQVPPPQPAPAGPIYDHTEAARRAVEELMGE